MNHIAPADTDEEAIAIARPAWHYYVWSLETPRRLEAERRGLTQFLAATMSGRPRVYRIERLTPSGFEFPTGPRNSSVVGPARATSAGTAAARALV